MISVGHTNTVCPTDFAYLGSTPLSIGVAALGGSDTQVYVNLRKGPSTLEYRPGRVIDFSLKNPSDMRIARFAAEPGVYDSSISVTSSRGQYSANGSIRVFPASSHSVTVANQSQLNDAIAAIKIARYPHSTILLRTSSYNWPSGSQYDLSDMDILLSFDGLGSPIFQFSGAPNLKWGNWYNCQFSNAVGGAFIADFGSVHAFESCAFSNSVTGLVVRLGSNARVEDCHLANLSTGIINAAVVRGVSWTKIYGTVFQNCATIEGTFGFRNVEHSADSYRSPPVWAGFDGTPLRSVSVRNNLVMDDYLPILRFDGSVSNFIMTGNTFVSSTDKPIVEIHSITSSAIINNTIHSTSSDNTGVISVAGNVSDNLVANNWFSSTDYRARKLADTGEWVSNGSTSTAVRNTDISTSTPEFSNNYMWLSANSPLLAAGRTLPDITMVQGIRVGRQIGSMNHHLDTGLTKIWRAMRFDSRRSFVMPAVV